VVSLTADQSTPVTNLRAKHEEADTRLLLHAHHASYSHSRVVIHSSDTDVAVICVALNHNITCELWFQTGSKDKLRMVPIQPICQKLGNYICSAILGFHAITGCDTTSAISGIGKKKAFSVLRKIIGNDSGLDQLGTQVPPSPQTVKACEKFVCALYRSSAKAGESADMVRHWTFCQKKQRNENLPPTSDSLRHHINRANYQSYVWKHALDQDPNLPSPVGNGWSNVKGQLMPVLMSKEPAPRGLLELTSCRCDKSACQRVDLRRCKANGLACTEACICMGSESCQNSFKPEFVNDTDSDSDSE
jgi:hypothetical protein